MYAALVSTAAQQSVELVVFPEAYGLARLTETAVFEPLISAVGAAPCDAAAGGAAQQRALSCLARQHGVVLAANVFVALANETKRIAELVYDARGTTLAVYFKHHLFPNEVLSGVSPGPFAPTVFTALGRTWGIIICYEGVYPILTGDFAQMNALVASGASGFVWSAGSEVPLDSLSSVYGEKYYVDVASTMDLGATPSSGAIVNASGAPLTYTDTRVSVPGYTGDAVLRVATVPDAARGVGKSSI